MEKTYFAEKPEIFNWFTKKPGDDFYLRNIGYHNFAFATAWRYEHRQTFHTLHFVISGKGVLLLNGKKYPIEANTVFYIDNDSLFAYYPDEKDPWEYVFFEFDGTHAKSVLEGTSLSHDNPMAVPKNPFALKNYLHAAFNGTPSYSYALSAFFNMLDQLASDEQSTARKNTRRDFVNDVKSYISAKFFDPDFSVEELCRGLFISHSHMCRIFKQYEKIPVVTYIKNTRLEYAASLLSGTNYSLKDIAIMSGFKDYGYFFRAFKKRYKETPTEYRDRIAAAPKE